MRTMVQRVAKLERNLPEGARCYVWAAAGEIEDELIAQQFPDGFAEAATVTVFRWSDGPPDTAGRWPQ
jgi:hypothetical protein